MIEKKFYYGTVQFVAKNGGVKINEMWFNPVKGLETKSEFKGKYVRLTLISDNVFDFIIEEPKKEPLDNQRLIVRQSCLKSAVEYSHSKPLTTKQILSIAEEFESWVYDNKRHN